MNIKLLVFVLTFNLVSGVKPRAESTTCLQHVDEYKRAFAASQPWALQMFDSATKIPSGLLYGNVVQLGNFDECLNIEESSLGLSGRWCRAVLRDVKVMSRHDDDDDDDLLSIRQLMLLPLKHALLNATTNTDVKMTESRSGSLPLGTSTLQWAICAPSSCFSEGINDILSFNMEQIGVAVSSDVITSSCFALGDSDFALDASSWGCISLILLFIVIAAVSTVYDIFVVQPSGEKFKYPVLLAFSLRGNVKNLFHVPRKPAPGTLTCLHGLRVMSMAWVLLGHRYYIQIWMPNINSIYLLNEFSEKWYNMLSVNAYLSVETFFILSGLLASYIACRNHKAGKPFSFLNYYLYRYVRLTVPLAMYVFFVATISDRMVHGPMWDTTIIPEAEGCRSNWWATLLYVNNYVDNKICGGQTWYLSVDMQFSWLAPILIIPLLKWPKPTMLVIGVLTLASTAAVFTTTYLNELFWSSPLTTKFSLAYDYWIYVYGNTPMRAVPYLCGLALGWILNQRWGYEGKWIPKWAWPLGWVLNTAMCLATIFTLVIAYLPDYKYNVVDAAFYGSLHRLSWSLGICWIIYACVTGHGGPVNYILSWRFWEPFSKLTYCAFLTHYLIVFMDGGLWRNPHFFSNFNSFHTFMSDLFFVFAASLVLYLLVEAPVTVILRELLGKDKPPRPPPASQTPPEEIRQERNKRSSEDVQC